jgi:hypothetical protein
MEFRNPVYIKGDNSLIDLEIKHKKHGWIPYTLLRGDKTASINTEELWDEVVAGSVTAYATPSNSVLYAELRSTRDTLLSDSDWTQVGDLVSSGAMTADKLAEWKTYRQSLRDLPANTSDPSSITWPTKPT